MDVRLFDLWRPDVANVLHHWDRHSSNNRLTCAGLTANSQRSATLRSGLHAIISMSTARKYCHMFPHANRCRWPVHTLSCNDSEMARFWCEIKRNAKTCNCQNIDRSSYRNDLCVTRTTWESGNGHWKYWFYFSSHHCGLCRLENWRGQLHFWAVAPQFTADSISLIVSIRATEQLLRNRNGHFSSTTLTWLGNWQIYIINGRPSIITSICFADINHSKIEESLPSSTQLTRTFTESFNQTI